MAEDPGVVLINDEWSRLSDDEYREAFDAWIAERLRSDPVDVSISAAEALRLTRSDTES